MASIPTSVRAFMKAATLVAALTTTTGCTSIRLRGGEIVLLPGPILLVFPVAADRVPLDEPGRNASVKTEPEPGLR